MSPSITTTDVDAIERNIGRVSFSRDGNVTRVNERFLEMFDYIGWELVGRNRRIFKPLRPDVIQVDVIDRAFRSGEPFDGEVQQSKRDGTLFWTEIFCHPVRGDEGAVEEVVVLVRDVTARMMSAAADTGQIAAINTSQAVIHFTMNGTVRNRPV